MKLYTTRNNGLIPASFWDWTFGDIFESKQTRMLQCDVLEKENGYELVLDVPGFSKEDVSITVESDVMKIKVERKQESKSDNYLVRERNASFERRFSIGKVDASQISAKCENGVLTVFLPKQKEPEVLQIAIN